MNIMQYICVAVLEIRSILEIIFVLLIVFIIYLSVTWNKDITNEYT